MGELAKQQAGLEQKFSTEFEKFAHIDTASLERVNENSKVVNAELLKTVSVKFLCSDWPVPDKGLGERAALGDRPQEAFLPGADADEDRAHGLNPTKGILRSPETKNNFRKKLTPLTLQIYTGITMKNSPQASYQKLIKSVHNRV